MIGNNDLHDISAALKIIREDIKNDNNIIILQSIMNVLSIRNQYEANQIRASISRVKGLDIEKWYFVNHMNLYTYDAIIKDDQAILLLKKICEKIIEMLELCEFDKAYDFVDTVHCLPDILAENHCAIPKSFWKNNMHNFRNKWDKNLFKSEQRLLHKAYRYKMR